MEIWNSLPPIAKAMLPIVALIVIGASANFLTVPQFVKDLKSMSLSQHIYMVSGALAAGMVTYLVVNKFFMGL